MSWMGGKPLGRTLIVTVSFGGAPFLEIKKRVGFQVFFSNIGILRIPDSFFTTEKDAGTVIPTCMSPKVPVPGAVLCVSC